MLKRHPKNSTLGSGKNPASPCMLHGEYRFNRRIEAWPVVYPSRETVEAAKQGEVITWARERRDESVPIALGSPVSTLRPVPLCDGIRHKDSDSRRIHFRSYRREKGRVHRIISGEADLSHLRGEPVARGSRPGTQAHQSFLSC
jgi:hypothetical protein